MRKLVNAGRFRFLQRRKYDVWILAIGYGHGGQSPDPARRPKIHCGLGHILQEVAAVAQMRKGDSILVVGADGLIGRALACRFAGEGRSMVQTALIPRPGAEMLDLARNAATWRPSQPISVAYLCAARTSLDYCRKHPVESRAVNVTGTVAVAEMLAAQGTQVVFLSSNLVLDGSTALAKTDASTRPQTEYGRQKAEVEHELLARPGVCVVRLTKVLGPNSPLLVKWATALRAGQIVRPFADMVMAPVPLTFAVAALCGVGAAHLTGIVQVSGTQDISYEQAARYIAQRVGAKQEQVQPVLAADSDLGLEHVPTYSTLDTTRLLAELQLAPPEPWTAIDLGMNPS
jgi:dTDP-4-dehydrorhamnose reductase